MSLITIQNEALTVTLDSVNAVLYSIRKDGIEYLWQGDPAYWGSRDYNLFPYVGRLNGGCYTYAGKIYSMPVHGFARGRDFAVTLQEADRVRFELTSSEETLAMFPFPFCFAVEYALDGCSVVKKCTVENTGTAEMYFGLGGHPGFNVPLGGEGSFEDWQLVFDEPCSPVRIDFHPETILQSGITEEYPLQDGRVLPLRHELFAVDAVVLDRIPRSVTLTSPLSAHSVKFSFPGMRYLGIWHKPRSNAPYVCLEPWVSLPSHHAYVEDLAAQEDIVHLPAGETYTNTVTISLQ